MRHKLPRFLLRLQILLLAALLRFYNLSGQSLWSDEGNSVALARRSFAEIAQHTAFDIHPPLYYWLLKIWITLFGDSEIGLRSLSVLLGIGLVYLIGVLGTRLFNPRVGVIAAFIAAFSPFQIYYAQEARMYMLLAVLSTLTVWAMLHIFEIYKRHTAHFIPFILLYILIVTAGLYTHYAYPIILLVVNVVALLQLTDFGFNRLRNPVLTPRATAYASRQNISNHPKSKIQNPKSKILPWFVLQLIPLLLYLPWLPTAWRQITTWPSEQQVATLPDVLNTILTTLLFGLSWPYQTGILATVGLSFILLLTGFTFYASRITHHRLSLTLLWLWLLLPMILTIFTFSPAFLKLLLIATPSLALLLAVVIDKIHFFLSTQPFNLQSSISNLQPLGNLIGGALLATIISTSLLSLYHYHTNATYARDNYRGIVQFIKAVGDADDAIILHAEGQQDVFNYYYQQDLVSSLVPVYPLPRRRPLNETETLAELQQIGDIAHNVYSVYWATYQADPNGLIEGWLDSHLFKATDQWYGNVRLVSYASPQVGSKMAPNLVDYQLGPNIRLTGYTLSTNQIVSGDILQVALRWQTHKALTEEYIVFLQILDQANHPVGQRDAQPPISTAAWPLDQPITDTYGIFIEPGTPPGKHRLIIGLYNRQTGQRLPAYGGELPTDFITLTEVEVTSPPVPLPLAAFNIQTSMNVPIGNLTLLGYDFYKLGHRSTPDTPLRPGDPVQLVAYWTFHQSLEQFPQQLRIRVATNYGQNTDISVNYPVAGVDYSVGEWSEDEIIRAQYDFFLSGLESGRYRLELSGDDQAWVALKTFLVE